MESQGSTELNNNSKGTSAGFSKLSSIEQDSIFAVVREHEEQKLDNLNLSHNQIKCIENLGESPDVFLL